MLARWSGKTNYRTKKFLEEMGTSSKKTTYKSPRKYIKIGKIKNINIVKK